ncbi:MAG: PD-(D/E)XK nuclease family protein, partial [Candidatus Nanopelagicales bacterium]
ALAAHLAGERRLFGLALTRADRHCHVAVIEREGEQGDRPSRFVDDLQTPIQPRPGRPSRSVTLDGLVAQLRSVAEDPDAAPQARGAAVRRLAALARAVDDDGDSLAPQADPQRWWGVRDFTTGLAPIRPPDRPVALSGSGLQSLNGCPLRWFLSRAARAEGPSSSAMAFGNIVHVLAERVGTGDLPPEPDILLQHAERIWAEVGFDMPWQSAAELAQLRQALERLCHYHRTCGRTVVDTEHSFDVTIPVDGLPADAAISIRGSIDRVEVDGDGGVHLIDFKTGKNPPSDVSVRTDAQLGMYQAAALAGAVEEVHDASDLAGAALVQLRKEAGKAHPDEPKIQPQPPLDPDDDNWLFDPVRVAVEHIRAEDFPATPNAACDHCAYRAVCPAQSEGQEVIA